MRLFWFFTLCLLIIGVGFASTAHAQECTYSGSPPAAVSKRHTQIRVLTHNVFGKRADSNLQCWDRMRVLGRYIARAAPRFDIVALQEHWNTADANFKTCGAKVLDEAIKSTGRYRQKLNFYRWYPEGEILEAETNGGISTYTAHPISKFTQNEWNSIPRILGVKVLHGSIFARIPLTGTAVTIDFYQAHLLAKSDGCDQECRRKELLELRKEIEANSSTSGNPVLVAGDFNIGGPTGNSCR